MKKLFKVELYDSYLNKQYPCYLLLNEEEEIHELLESLEVKVINIRVDNFYFSTKKFNVDKMKVIVDNLYLLISSGLTLFDGLSFLVFNDQVDKFIRGVLFKSYFMVRKGLDYETSFDFYELDEYFKYILSISKTTYALRKNLANLKDYYENVKLSRESVEKSIIYPFLVFSSIMIILVLLKFFIIPEFSTLLGYEINLNLSTYLLTFMLISFLVGLIILILGKNNDIIWTRIPILKYLYKNYILFTFTREINLLIKSGLTIYNSLDTVLSNTKSQYILSKFLTVSIDLEEGKDINEVFSKIKDIKEFSLTMSISKWKGDYKEVFDFLEKFYYSSFKNASEKLLKMLEPILIIFLSLIVVSLAFEIYSNVYLGGMSFEI
ncbi:MAG TPA: type II secretion system F family protein [Defluviitoga sp.]|nr:type II secretion system F family protein [Defluviitoga sp.]HOP23853.1 type II secretion system F family protein [Defluviitoga sp.]HPZ28400.1 type II secretion system F family protein [Defluviitoga sp.]HQD62498.1 type II secretion system F family protein [Defluviitoga sp.]